MAVLDVLRGITKGVAEASGATDAANDISQQQERARQGKANEMQFNLAPLTQALQASRTRLALYADPNDPTKAVAGKEAEYAAAHDNVADVIGKMRTILHPPPAEDPHGLGYLGARALDKLHITRDLAGHMRDTQSGKVDNYYQQGADQTQNVVKATPPPTPGALTPEELHRANLVKGGIEAKAVPAKPTTETSDTRARADFDAYKKDHPEYKGSFEQWKTEQAGAGRNAAKQPGRDDRYIAILQKQQEGQPLTQEDKAYQVAYKMWNKETKVDPGIARAAAFGANRFVPVIDPQDPENVTFMRVGEAAASHAGSPAGIAFQTDKALTRAFTSGQPAQTINYFNTATEHLKQLQQAADALQNGDQQLFNKWGNTWATATGNPAPTNFATIRNAVAGELSKTFKGAAATDAEIDAINTSINSSQSPAQLSGAIQNNIRLMGSKMEALKGQYEQGKKGQPNFPGSPKNTKGRVSLKKAMGLAENKGKTQQQVKAEITAQGYEAIP